MVERQQTFKEGDSSMAFNKNDRFFRVTGDTNTGFDFTGQILKYIGPSCHQGLEEISIVLEQPPFDMDGKKCGGTLTIDKSKVEEVFRCFTVTPKRSSGMRYDLRTFKDTGYLSDAFIAVEEDMEMQWMNQDEDHIPWEGLGVNLECVWQTKQELDDLDTDE